MQVTCGEGVPGGDVREADEGVHHGQLPRVIELESWNAFAVGQACRFGELAYLAAVDERLQDILLDRLVAVRHGRHGLAEFGHGVDGLRDTEVADVVGRGLRAEQQMIADVLFDGAVAVVAADHGIREVEIFDQRFELAAVPLGHLPAEDVREFCGLPNRTVRIEQTLAERVQRGTPVEDHVIRVLDLREEESMLTAGGSSLRRGEERREGPQPLLRTAVDVAGRPDPAWPGGSTARRMRPVDPRAPPRWERPTLSLGRSP